MKQPFFNLIRLSDCTLANKHSRLSERYSYSKILFNTSRSLGPIKFGIEFIVACTFD